MSSSQSVDWQQLHHAYGAASDIPALLKKVDDFPAEPDWRSEPWFSLWNALHHQGQIYSASIAAAAHIICSLAKSPDKATLSFYLLPTSIAIADRASPVDVAPSIRTRFNEALSTLGATASATLPFILDPHVARAARAAVLASAGDFHQAEELLEAER